MICAKPISKYIKVKICQEKRRKKEHFKENLLKMQRNAKYDRHESKESS